VSKVLTVERSHCAGDRLFEFNQWLTHQPDPLRSDTFKIEMLDDEGRAVRCWHYMPGLLADADGELAIGSTDLVLDVPIPDFMLALFEEPKLTPP
jgi:hypothetical protein